MNKWTLLPPRARRLPERVYTAIVVVDNATKDSNPQVILWSQNVAFLHQIVNEHNELVELREKILK